MYCESAILRRLESAKKVLGWLPEPHSIEEVQRFIARMSKLEYQDPKAPSITRVTRDPTPMETTFIRNEIQMCACDANYFLTHYCWIKDPSNTPIQFKWRTSQRVYFKQLQWLEEQGYSQEMMLLKARQQYMTTIVLLLMTHRICFGYGVNAVSASCDKTKSEEIASRVFFALDHTPWWLKPTEKKRQEGKHIAFENECSMTVQSGNQVSGIARGSTPTCVHLCLSPHTLIHCKDGMLKPVSEIEAGETIITHTGQYAKVKRLVVSSRSNELTSEVWLWGNFSSLSSTRDHQIRTLEGWQPASSLRSHSYVIHPVRSVTDEIDSFMVEHLPHSNPKYRLAKQETYNLSRDWGFLLGLYLAEGSLGSNKKLSPERSRACSIIFSCDLDETDYFRDRLESAVQCRWPIKNGRTNGKSRTRNLVIHSAGLARWIYNNFGKTDGKRVPDWVWRGGRDFCLGIVEGYLEGDGHYVPDSNEIYASSVRVQIPIQIRDLIASLGFGWSSIQYKKEGVYYERNCRAQWTIIICAATGQLLRKELGIPWKELTDRTFQHWQWVPDSNAIAMEVEQVHDGFSEQFFDLEIDHTDHSFTTAQCAVHNSEVADFPDPKDLIEASLFRAVHPHPKVFLMLESTGNSNVGWWAETWRKSKADWHRGLARLCPMFIPWFINTELYPTPTWLHMHPVPPDWRPIEETTAHISKCQAYVRNTDYLVRELGKDWKLSREQAWFWEVNYQEHRAKRIEREWLQEMPADDYEALQSRQEKVFTYEVLTRIESNREKHPQAFAIVGEGIEEKFYPLDSQIDYALPRIPVEWTGKGKTYRWQLIPLSIPNLESEESGGWDAKLLVYEFPSPGVRYSMGIDTAHGQGLDRTVFSVDRPEDGAEPDVQVAELASAHISGAESYAFAMAVCAWYDMTMMACEQVQAPGDICQVQMHQMGWPWSRVHSMIRYDGKKLQKGKAPKKGWYTHSYTRDLLLDMFIGAVNNGWYKVNSVFLARECENFEARLTDSGMGRMEHVQGKHDDRIFAAAISYMIMHDLKLLIERSKKRYNAPSGKLPELVLEPVINTVPFRQVAPTWERTFGRIVQVPM
jgi:hypothetical protein